MRKLFYISAILLTAFFASCSEEDILQENAPLTPEQEALIGRAINFNASCADVFYTRASSYTDYYDGSFNQNDRMRIYRNYYDSENGQWSDKEAYRTYRYVYKSDVSTGIDLGKDWQPEDKRRGYDDRDGDGVYETFEQTTTDSLVWENGKTVRFRAWSQSNYHNVLAGATRNYFYPDFCVSDYVNASGPSTSIPMVLKHQGTRIWFQVLESGNEFADIRLCTSINPDGTANSEGWRDYKYADNSDTNDNDNAETAKSDGDAQAECEAVTAVFKRMCMPAGVDITNGTLKAVSNKWWNSLSADTDADRKKVRFLEDQDESIFYKYNTQTSEFIASNAKRPFFSIINTYPIMVTIPYDISKDPDKQGEILTLPACTRFRVYLRDINKGDQNNTSGNQYNTSGYEGKYHIFALSDVKKIVKDAENKDVEVQAFPDGLKLGAGLSYIFKVGYRYGGLYVVVDNNISWTEQNLADAEAKDEIVSPTVNPTPYKWWQDAIHNAIPKGTEDFKPVFHISNETEFLEFINLVNGTTECKTEGLYLLDYATKDAQGKPITIKRWSTVNSIYKPDWVTEEEMVAQGYLFYDHYYAANADKAAHSERDYLKGPYPFYDDNLRRNFTVELDASLDLKDWLIESVGNTVDTPFRGCFDGNGNTIKNLYLREENLFGYVNGIGTEHASITNLKIESLHNTCLMGTGVNQIYIAGISIYAPSTTNSIAHSMSMEEGVSGTSYVVGCIHVGDAGGALVGEASNLNMFGCMQAAHGITGGALIGEDRNSSPVFKPQYKLSDQKNGKNVNSKPTFRNFIANYYDKEISPSANAVGLTSDDYSLLEYIRGSKTDILRAKNDYLTTNVTMKQLLAQSNYTNYYGLAPWRAMNYAIYWYNKNRVTSQVNHPCTMHFENNTIGYSHQYPVLKDLAPEDASVYGETLVNSWNPVAQTN